LSEVAHQRVGNFSLGMGQRLGIASALLGDPATVILDEPVNGLDPEGVLWVRTLLTDLAAEGRTVFLSSHLINEMALTAHHVIVVGRGKLIADVDVATLTASASSRVIVRSPEANELRDLLVGPDVSVTSTEQECLMVSGLDPERIGDLARDHDIAIHELRVETGSLEDAFMAMTADAVEFHASAFEGSSI
jgi:ABC-2 type transport system ATP-binding protein